MLDPSIKAIPAGYDFNRIPKKNKINLYRLHKIHITKLWLQTVIDFVKTTGFKTVFKNCFFLNPLISRHVGSLHGSMGNVGMSVSAQPLLPLGDNHVGMYKQYVHYVHLVHL